MRRLLALILTICSCIDIFSFNSEVPEWEIETTVNTAYLYHGKCYGGLSVQHDFNFTYDGIELEAWFNEGDGSYWKFNSFNGEIDTRIGYRFFGLGASLKQYYYYKGNPFDFEDKSKNNQLLARFDYDFSEIGLCNLKVGYMVHILGAWDGDRIYNKMWIDAKYDGVIPIFDGNSFVVITPSIGMCPNFIREDGRRIFTFNEISFRFKFEQYFTDNSWMNIFVDVMMNTYDMSTIHKDYMYINAGIGFGLGE